jgi:hypothetical protein
MKSRKLTRVQPSSTALAIYSGGQSARSSHFDAMAKNLLKIRMENGGPRTPQPQRTP